MIPLQAAVTKHHLVLDLHSTVAIKNMLRMCTAQDVLESSPGQLGIYSIIFIFGYKIIDFRLEVVRTLALQQLILTRTHEELPAIFNLLPRRGLLLLMIGPHHTQGVHSLSTFLLRTREVCVLLLTDFTARQHVTIEGSFLELQSHVIGHVYLLMSESANRMNKPSFFERFHEATRVLAYIANWMLLASLSADITDEVLDILFRFGDGLKPITIFMGNLQAAVASHGSQPFLILVVRVDSFKTEHAA